MRSASSDEASRRSRAMSGSPMVRTVIAAISTSWTLISTAAALRTGNRALLLTVPLCGMIGSEFDGRIGWQVVR
ncbi:hypothetical protein BBK14_26570 [Parafrankia soli]|uniref:Uncharacterized protein n=1 Tax=Parafrankia soli TaxID=2599596 RepID=A0A1S1PKT4_9ACTN|nr:hypothetical protein BBK14_26570 [Parafrankia soli]